MVSLVVAERLEEGCAHDFVAHGCGEVLQPVRERAAGSGCGAGHPGVEGATAYVPVRLWDDV